MATRKWRIPSFTQSPTQVYFKTTYEKKKLQITSICYEYSIIYNTAVFYYAQHDDNKSLRCHY